jgi:hypothetical protein
MNGIKKTPWNLPFKFETENNVINEHGNTGTSFKKKFDLLFCYTINDYFIIN